MYLVHHLKPLQPDWKGPVLPCHLSALPEPAILIHISKDVNVLSGARRKLAFWVLIRTLNRVVAMAS